jgi:uncharacterized membrane protein
MSLKQNTNEIRQHKKAFITAQPGRHFNFKRVVPAAIILALAAGVGLYLTNHILNIQGTADMVSASKTDVHTDQVSFPLTEFADGKARHYAHDFNGMTIKYFILKSSDGVVRAAFDACDVCWRAGKGYVQQGDFMICRNCGRQFDSVMVNEVQGGCNPAPLKRRVEGQQLIIRIQDIEKGSRFFDFRGKV